MAASQAGLQVKKAEAYQSGETRKVQAEAAVLEAEHTARAKAALAEAQRIEAERRAALEAPAKADKAKIEVEASAEAAKRRIEAEGEASAIFAKLEAEARGQFEILSKKGQGLQQIIQACGSRPAGLPIAHARTLRPSRGSLGQGDLQHQVRQGRGLGEQPGRRAKRHGQLAAQHVPHPAADDAGHARHRRRGNPRNPGHLAGMPSATRRPTARERSTARQNMRAKRPARSPAAASCKGVIGT